MDENRKELKYSVTFFSKYHFLTSGKKKTMQQNEICQRVKM